MANSSPPRRQSYLSASPHRFALDDILGEDRNSEARHNYLLEAEKREHIRVSQDAQRVIDEQKQRDERQRLLDELRKEEERIKLEQQVAAERVRVNALRAKKIEIPPYLPEPKPPAAPAVKTPPTAAVVAPSAKDNVAPLAPGQTNGLTPQQPAAPASGASSGFPVPSPQASSLATQRPPAAAPNNGPEPPKPPTSALGVNGLLNSAPQPNGVNSGAGTPRPAPPPIQTPDRHTEVWKNLKNLRKFMQEQAATNPALKARMGDMRREIRKSVGQLAVPSKAGANKPQQVTILTLLREALANQMQSQLMDPSHFVLEPRNPVEGAVHNEPVLPSIFLYLLNILAKAAISQYINEAGARPETADPVGICIAAAFSEPTFQWRGQSMIDILLAKFRIVCPVLFGYRGSEKTEQGRQRLGWWKDSGRWIPEQQHMDRMTGLGAGFASISLRNFSQSAKTNPFPPRNYWTAMARIVDTPSAEISNTQCVVLKAMIQNYEQKFIECYGTAAIAALHIALVVFPARAPTKSAAVTSLAVLAQLLKKNTGLVLG